LLSSNISSTCPHNMVNFGPPASEIGMVVWGTPANFNGFRILAVTALLYWALAKLCRAEQRAPPMFARAATLAITLGIGPHSILVVTYLQFSIQVCFPCIGQPIIDTASVTNNLVVLIIVLMMTTCSLNAALLWPPCVPDVDIIFCSCGFYLLFSSPILSSRRLDVYHTSTHDVDLVQI